MAQPAPRRKLVGEWFWRFLAGVMVVTVAWVLWIAYQLNPPPLIMPAAFEAAAKARAARNVQGVIAPAPGPSEAPQGDRPEAPAAAAQPQPAPEPREPPVNVEKLRLSDAIESPIPEKPEKK